MKLRLVAASAIFAPLTASDGVGSSSVIVMVADESEIVEFEALDKVTVNVSLTSSMVS